jgi:hypothetical protein
MILRGPLFVFEPSFRHEVVCMRSKIGRIAMQGVYGYMDCGIRRYPSVQNSGTRQTRRPWRTFEMHKSATINLTEDIELPKGPGGIMRSASWKHASR